MRILPINQKPHAKVTSFKGLWGEPRYETYMLDSSYYIYEHREIKDYFPFLGESKQEMDSAVKRNTFSLGGLAEWTDEQSHVVEIGETLNFTKSEWRKYLSGRLKKSLKIEERLTADLIENTLKRLNLTKYIK